MLNTDFADTAALITAQRHYFSSGVTHPFAFRLQQLQRLKLLLQTHEGDIYAALQKDLRKSTPEAFITELSFVERELNLAMKQLKQWMRPKKVSTPFPALWPGHSHILSEPYGVALIIAPWNFPVMLLFAPLIGAICAGNCMILKPSDMALETQTLIIKLIKHYFPPQYITTLSTPTHQMPLLLQEKFDYIFYTGGERVGKIIMQAAALHLTPVTLELGGKSPCIVDESATLPFAARRIAWAKSINAGQACIAPDYILVHHRCKDALITALIKAYQKFFGENAQTSKDYGRIVNQHHFQRLHKLLQQSQVVFGGTCDENDLYIQPAIIDSVHWHDPIMQEEIFGPILPIITFETMDEVISNLKSHAKPLAMYLFTQNKTVEKNVLQQISFGGVGASGMGAYHGHYSFNTFSHQKSIYKKTVAIDCSFQYPPFSPLKFRFLRWLLS